MIAKYRKWNLAHHDEYVTEFDGVNSTLEQLKEQGIKMAIVSTKKRDTIERGLKLMKAEHYFEFYIGIEDVKNVKPNPEPVLLALEKLGVSNEEALMIGDNYHDIVAGKNAGVKTAGVAWSIKGEEYLKQFNPDYMLYHMTDLLGIVKGVVICEERKAIKVEGDANSLWNVYKTVSFWKVVKCFIFIQIGRITPFMSMKNWIYRTFLKMKIGKKTSIALMVMPDTMFPESVFISETIQSSALTRRF